MHNYVVPASVKDRVVSRMGKLLAHDTIEADHTALIVVDMQNYFCVRGFPHEVPTSREIVPNINRMARAVRAAGGAVVWIQMTAIGALEHWANYQTRMLTPDRQKKRLSGLDEASEGFKLFPEARGTWGRRADQKDQIQRLHARLLGHRRAAQSPRHRHATDHGRGDERVLRINGARRDAARLQGHNVVGRNCDVDRGGARGRAQYIHDVLRRRDEHRRGDRSAGPGLGPQNSARIRVSSLTQTLSNTAASRQLQTRRWRGTARRLREGGSRTKDWTVRHFG